MHLVDFVVQTPKRVLIMEYRAPRDRFELYRLNSSLFINSFSFLLLRLN